MPRRVRTIEFAIIAALAGPATAVLTAQQVTTAGLVGMGVSAGYVALSIGSIVRLVGHSREATIGSWVRGRSASMTGMVTAIDSDSVTIRSEAGDERLARIDVQGLRVHEGSERKWAQGWGIGFLSGAATGALIGVVSEAPADDPSCEFICPTREADTIIGSVVFGVTGSVVGALFGAAARGERWSRINSFVERTGFRVAPRAGALGVGARISF